MTTVHWITVSEALRVRIQTELSIQVERRYAAFLDKSKVKTPGKYIVIPSAMEQEAKTLDRLLTITVDVGFQIALPDPNKDYLDQLDNTGWFDEQATKVQKILGLVRPGRTAPRRKLCGGDVCEIEPTAALAAAIDN